jgi:hypothetical protein
LDALCPKISHEFVLGLDLVDVDLEHSSGYCLDSFFDTGHEHFS